LSATRTTIKKTEVQLMKIKSWGQYLPTILIIIFWVFGASNNFRLIEEVESRIYIPQIWLRTTVAFFYYGGVGVLLGLNHFTVEMKKKGVWRANWPKLIVLGLPSLFYSFSLAIATYGGPFFGRMSYILASQLINNYWDVAYLFPLVLGHTIITGFYKYDATHHE
jgi:hypothetical protein